jgi:hypothetical protein
VIPLVGRGTRISRRAKIRHPADGDPNLCLYGWDITPNHLALAEQYVTLDNFYSGGAISFDGHQGLMQAFVSDYVERAFVAPRGYAWNMSDALALPTFNGIAKRPGWNES